MRIDDKKISINLKTLILVVVLLVLFISVFFIYNTYQKNKIIRVEAVIYEVRDNDVVVEDDSGVHYLLSNINEYNVGDKVIFEMKNLDKRADPIQGDIVKIETISKSVEFVVIDDRNQVDEVDSTSSSDTSTISPDTSLDVTEEKVDNVVSNDVNDSEEEVVAYFTNLNNDIMNTTSSDITDSLKSGFITVVDFLFYDGTIKGWTFSELTDETKIKVLKLAFSIDSKIEEKFPDYKEQISDKSTKVYSNVKAKILEAYLNLTTKVCQNNQELCNSAKEGLSDLKKNFSISWNFVKDISGVGLSKLKSWYEIWRES